jgi:hypothetical protein
VVYIPEIAATWVGKAGGSLEATVRNQPEQCVETGKGRGGEDTE